MSHDVSWDYIRAGVAGKQRLSYVDSENPDCDWLLIIQRLYSYAT